MSSVREAEEKAVIFRIATLLHSLTSRLNGPTISGVTSVMNEIAMDAPELSITEATELIPMISQVVASAVRDPDHLRTVLYEVHPQLVPILLSFLQAPQTVAPGDTFATFFRAVLNCVTDIVCSCCKDLSQKATKATPPPASTTTSGDDSWEYLHQLTARTLLTMDAVPLTVGLLSPLLPEDVQQSAAELLFALLVRVEDSRMTLAQTQSFKVLYSALHEQHNPNLRTFVAACIREFANTHATLFLEDANAMDVLMRLVSLDVCADVRALAAETIETVFRNEPGALLTFSRLRELSAVIVDRLESSVAASSSQRTADSDESDVAALKLTETLLTIEMDLAAYRHDESHNVDSDPTSSSSSSSFAEHLLSAYADRLLIDLVKPDARIGSLAAHCLRLLIQIAPFYRYAAFHVVQHFPMLSKILKVCVHMAMDPTQKSIVSQITRTETSLLLALCLAQDPRCRQLLASQLLEHPHYMSQLRSALLSNLNSAALDYFGDVVVVDATGERLNRLAAVEWEAPNGARPTKASVQRVFDDQEERWATTAEGQRGGGGGGVGRHRRDVTSSEDESRLQRLTFILLTYAVHITLDVNSGATRSASMGQQQQQAAAVAAAEGNHNVSQAQYSTTVIGSGGGGAPVVVSSAEQILGSVGGPLPTRSSMLREWGAHPQKAGAVVRAVERQQQQQQQQPLGLVHNTVISNSADTTTYTRVNFRDPYQAQQQQQLSFMGKSSQAKSARGGGGGGGASPAVAFSKFDSALKLTRQFAQYFSSTSAPNISSTVYMSTGDGFARRQTTSAVPSSSSAPPPSNGQVKSWGIQQLKEGDLFYFSVPLIDLSIATLEQVRARAIRHLNVVKKSFVVTPQAAKARRWFLFDMSTHILPGIVHTLSQLIELFVLHGEEAAKFPMLMFRDQEIKEDIMSGGGGGGGGESLPTDASLNAGNLLELLDQTRFYFNKVQQGEGTGRAGSRGGGGGDMTVMDTSANKSTYLADLERKISYLSTQHFHGNDKPNQQQQQSMPGGYPAAAIGNASSPAVRIPTSFNYDSDDERLI